MTDLDEELRRAVAESEEPSDPEHGPPPAVTSRAEQPAARNLGLLIGLLVAAGAILTLVFTSVEDAAIYSVATDQLIADQEKFSDKTIRVEGELVPGTLTRRDEPCEYRFRMQKNEQELSVRYPACVVPDTFKDVPGMPVQVTAEGRLNPEGHFDATHIMAKCPSKYEMQQRAADGEAAPHAMMGEPAAAEPAVVSAQE